MKYFVTNLSFLVWDSLFSIGSKYSPFLFKISFHGTQCTKKCVLLQSRGPFFNTTYLLLSRYFANCQSGFKNVATNMEEENAPQTTSGQGYAVCRLHNNMRWRWIKHVSCIDFLYLVFERSWNLCCSKICELLGWHFNRFMLKWWGALMGALRWILKPLNNEVERFKLYLKPGSNSLGSCPCRRMMS